MLWSAGSYWEFYSSGNFFEEELLEIERFAHSTTFVWGLRILILGAIIFLIRKNEWLIRVWQKREFKYSLYIIYGIGLMGWLLAIIDLVA